MLQFADYALKRLPEEKAPLNWKKMPIQENNEPLIALATLKNPRLLIKPAYIQMGIPDAISEMYVRSGVAQKLIQVVESLPQEYCLLIWDAWRPLAVQQALFETQYKAVQQRQPDLSSEELIRQTEKYVSIPSSHVLHPSPHFTGGAIDLTLADNNGKALWMGTEFDAFHEGSRTHALEKLQEKDETLSEDQRMALHNRRLLYHTMVASGFSNYCEEWWHYDYGDQFWSAVTGHLACYGPIKPEQEKE